MQRATVMPDDHSEVVPLLPIPNRTVKRLSADDSAGSRVKVGHRQAINPKGLRRIDGGLFLLLDSISRTDTIRAMLARIQQLIVLADRRDRRRRRARRVQARSARAGRWRRRCSSSAATRRRWRSSSPGCVRPTTDGLARPADDRASCSRAWLAEVADRAAGLLWRQPFRSAAIADFVPGSARGRRGVVLVHGFFCNRGLWNPWMRRLPGEGHSLRGRDPRAAVRLDRPLSSTRSTPRSPGSSSATGMAPVLVGAQHGRAGDPRLAGARGDRARRCPPHRHHRHAARAAPRLARACAHAQRRSRCSIGSAWLEAAERERRRRQPTTRFTCFWGHCDNIVFPTRGATLAGRRQPASSPGRRTSRWPSTRTCSSYVHRESAALRRRRRAIATPARRLPTRSRSPAAASASPPARG